jgi:predicted amidophosphoribosyltransferase
VQATRTQTRKARYARWENVSEVFAVALPEQIRGKHLLLVDDVITTGATMEAAARRLRDAGAEAVSLLAFASTFR